MKHGEYGDFRLRNAALARLRRRSVLLTYDKIAAEAGLNALWLRKFAERGDTGDAASAKLLRLYEYLAGETLDITG